MDYEEFKWALGDNVAVPRRGFFERGKPIGDDINRNLMREFRLYMLIGGIPKAVSTYVETNSMRLVDEEKRKIIKLYESDFAKIDPTGRTAMLSRAIPAQPEKCIPLSGFICPKWQQKLLISWNFS